MSISFCFSNSNLCPHFQHILKKIIFSTNVDMHNIIIRFTVISYNSSKFRLEGYG